MKKSQCQDSISLLLEHVHFYNETVPVSERGCAIEKLEDALIDEDDDCIEPSFLKLSQLNNGRFRLRICFVVSNIFIDQSEHELFEHTNNLMEVLRAYSRFSEQQQIVWRESSSAENWKHYILDHSLSFVTSVFGDEDGIFYQEALVIDVLALGHFSFMEAQHEWPQVLEIVVVIL